MIKFFLILSGCLVMVSVSFSQTLENVNPLARSYTYENKTSESEPWEPTSKRILSYDQNENLSTEESYRWVTTTWKRDYQWNYGYDNAERVISETYKSWSEYTNRLDFKFTVNTEYSDDRIIRREYNSINYTLLENYSDVLEYSYNENDHLTEVYTLYKYIKNKKLLERNETLTKYYYDQNGCNSGYAYRYREEGDWYLRDSIAIVSDSKCKRILFQYYGAEFDGGPLTFEYEERYFEELDENGNQVEYRVDYRYSTSEEWKLSYLSQKDYNAEGKITEEYYIYARDIETPYEYRNTFEYNESGQLIGGFAEINTDGTWVNRYYWVSEFNALGKLTYSGYWYFWDETLSDYRESNESWIEYDQNQFPVYREYYYRLVKPDGEILFERIQSNLQFQCDGRELENVTSVVESSNQSLEGFQTRRTIDYYRLPDCQTEEIFSSIMNIFPNPARDYIHVYYPTLLGETKVRLTDESGREVINQEIRAGNYFSLDLKGQKPGVYILTIESDRVKDSNRVVKVN